MDKFFGRVRGFEDGYRQGLTMPEIMAKLFAKVGKVKGKVTQHRTASVAGLSDLCKKKIFFF